MNNKFQILALLLIATTISITSFPGYSQEATLEEIVVTAQKRSESLQDVPISIQAFSSDEIERLNISNTIDLS